MLPLPPFRDGFRLRVAPATDRTDGHQGGLVWHPTPSGLAALVPRGGSTCHRRYLAEWKGWLQCSRAVGQQRISGRKYRGGQLKCATWSGVGGCPAGPLLYAIHTPHTCYIRIILGPLRAFPFRCPRAMTWCDRLPSWSAIPQFAPAMQLFWVKLATAQGHQNGLSGVGACGV